MNTYIDLCHCAESINMIHLENQMAKRPTPQKLIGEIRKRAYKPDAVIWPMWGHAEARSKLRSSSHEFDLDFNAALRVLKVGDIEGRITRSELDDGWEAKVVGPVSQHRGDLDAGVVVIVLDDGKLLVKTVEWEWEYRA